MLAPLRPADPKGADALVYPAPKGDLGRVQAKQLLARLYGASPGKLPPRWGADLKAYRARHGKAAGALAGSKGAYVDLLADLAAKRTKVAAPAELPGPTFGGDATRGLVVPAPPRLLDRLSQLCRGGPTWRLNLATRKLLDGALAPRLRPETETERARGLAFHPVVVGHRVLVADARYVTALDVRTGTVEEWYDVKTFRGGINPELGLPATNDLRYTLTVADGCVLARLGTQFVRDVRPEEKGVAKLDTESLLVCLSLAPGPGGKRERWAVSAIEPGRSAVFEGAPVSANGLVYVAATRFEGDKVITAIHCYPLHPEDVEPALLWRTDVCETRELLPGRRAGAAGQRVRHHLLTLAGSQVVYCSHSGAVVALDARTGKRAWGLRYPRRDGRAPEDEPELRDLAPCLFADGRLYVAPNDSDWLLCLAPETGRTIWERRGLDAVHLLGVGQGRLIFTARRNPGTGRSNAGGLRAVGASDGSDSEGWSLPDDGGGLAPMGRGLLVGDLVLWPTARSPYGVFAVRQLDGRQSDNPALLHRMPAGNLVFANGCLVVAGRRTLSVFVPPGMLLEEAEKAARADPDSAPVQLALARAEVDRALPERARASYDKALRLTASPVGHLAKVARQEALLGRQALLLEQARRATRPKDAEEALRLAGDGVPARARLLALVEAGRLFEEQGEPARAAMAWEAVRGPLAEEMVEEAGLPRRAGEVAKAALGRLKGRGLSGRPEGGTAAEKGKADFGELAVPLRRRWEATLGPGEKALAAAGDVWTGRGRVFSARGKEGEVRWTARLAFVPEWAAPHADLIVTAGAGGIAGLRQRDGLLLWSFRAPSLARYPATPAPLRVALGPLPAEPLANFALVGGRCFCVQGERRLLALGATTGEVLWQRWAPGTAFRMPFPRGRFASPLFANDAALIVQASGRLWALDAGTGHFLRDAPTSLRPWPRPPLALGERAVCIVPDEHQIHCVDAKTGKSLWTYALRGATTRSGEPPLVVGRGDALLVVEPANVGYWLQRLDRDGKPQWARPRLLALDRLREAEWAVDGSAIYHVQGAKVVARALIDGKVLWERLQKGGPWRLSRVGDYLLAWPERTAALRFQFRSGLGSLQWTAGPVARGRAIPVLCLDAKTGHLVQRLNFLPSPANGKGEARRDQRGAWAWLGPEAEGWPGPFVRLTSGGMVVAVGGRAWLLGGELGEGALGPSPPRR